MLIIGGSASKMLAGSLAKVAGAKLASVEIRRFPDREGYVRICDDVSGQDVAVVQNTYPDENLVELLMLQDAVRLCKPRSITAVIPYFGYARQDKLFKPGEAVSASSMARHIQMDADRVITIDIHNKGTLSAFSKPVSDVTAMPQIAEHLRAIQPDIIISQDKGAVDRARTVADIIGCQWDHLEKTRIDGETVEMKAKSLDVSGKVVVITDDIISTGGTIIKATEHLKRQGATKVLAACTHGLFTGGALAKLDKACDGVIATDTLENERSVVSAAPAVAREMGI